MQRKHDEGFSLVEILVAIAILASFVIPICSSMILASEMNHRTDALMQAQLAVSSAVETLMAEGIPEAKLTEASVTEVKDQQQPDSTLYSYKTFVYEDVRFSTLTISVEEVYEEVDSGYVLRPWYKVKVTSVGNLVEITTSVRRVS